VTGVYDPNLRTAIASKPLEVSRELMRGFEMVNLIDDAIEVESTESEIGEQG
jgi:hypothetical protein